LLLQNWFLEVKAVSPKPTGVGGTKNPSFVTPASAGILLFSRNPAFKRVSFSGRIPTEVGVTN